jgi:hypothetical protein
MGLEPWLEFLLGLAYTPDATQIKEAQRFLSLSRETGLVEVRLLNGSCDIYFDSLPGSGQNKATKVANVNYDPVATALPV